METNFWQEVLGIILNGMKFSHFVGYYIVALLGVTVFFCNQLYSSIKNDKRSPDKFSWTHFWKTAPFRIIMGAICIWAAIAYYGDLSVILLRAKEPLQITGFAAVILGIGIDTLIKGFLDIKKNSIQVIKSANGG